ncbi:MAG TPA: DUF1569 domain-containing protein [Planctomycetaceae bacterium]|nr:DUF1569 domain-containing protein [Planctomycetaceae bacterium]
MSIKSGAINTAKVQGRRKLRFATFDELVADIDRLSSGPVKVLGNWSPGQVFRHLATAYNGSIDGFTMTFPLHFRLIAKVFRKKLLTMQMPAGFKLPPKGAAMLEPPSTATDEGAAQLRAAIERLKREPKRANHPMFGELTREEWDRVHLTHASLHLSFLVPEREATVVGPETGRG